MTGFFNPSSYDVLVNDIKQLIEVSRTKNIMVAYYWEIGRLIDEFVGTNEIIRQQLIKKLSRDLHVFDNTFSKKNLRKMNLFFKYWQVSEITSEQSIFKRIEILTQYFLLPWSVYSILCQVDNPNSRNFYESLTLKGGWDEKTLKHYINQNKNFKFFEFCEFKDEFKLLPALFYRQAKEFYAIFESFLTQGYKPVESTKCHTWENLLAYMVSFHFCIELMLKAIILTREELPEGFTTGKKGHNLVSLLKHIKCRLGIKIAIKDDENAILVELTKCFSLMRYREGSLQIRYENPQMFPVILKGIFDKIEREYEKCITNMQIVSIV